MRTLLRIAAVLLALMGAAVVYLWTGKRTLVSESRRYVGAKGISGKHEFALLSYAVRPILVWRASAAGSQLREREATFGAWTVEKLDPIEWCGEGRGVLVSGVVQHDFEESVSLRLFYDFDRDSLVTTLDGSTKVEDVDHSFRHCEAQ